MTRDFDDLFGQLPDVLLRCEDGKLVFDKSHPLVAAAVAASREFLAAGGTRKDVDRIVADVFADVKKVSDEDRRRLNGR
jgi:hypothetical protein